LPNSTGALQTNGIVVNGIVTKLTGVGGPYPTAFHRRKPALFALLVSVLVLVLTGIGVALAKAVTGKTEGPKAIFLIELPGVLLFVWLVSRTAGNLGLYTPRRWASPWLLLIPFSLVVLNGIDIFSNPDFHDLGWKVSSNLMIGVLEEASLRGLVLVALVRAWGTTPKGLIRAVVASSSVFGMLHLVNLFNRPVIPTLLQVVFATFIGMGFAGVFLRTRALLALMIIHGMIDLAEVLKVSSNKPETVTSALVACAVTLPYALLGVWLLRRGLAGETVEAIRSTRNHSEPCHRVFP
jgi:membrane protease YdiL (CAAX protease family)